MELVAQDIITKTFGQPATSINRFPTGLMHFVYDCNLADGKQVVIRLTAPEHRSVAISAAKCSDALRPLGVPLPQIIAHDFESKYPYLVLERLPGTDLGDVISKLSKAEKATIAREIAHIQTIASSLPSANRYGYADDPKNAPHQKWSGVLHASLDRSFKRISDAGLMPVESVDRVRDVVKQKEDILNKQPATPFLHDTTTKNVIVNNGKLSGIVDVDDLCYGDPAFTQALTLMSLLKSGSPVDYVKSWLDASEQKADWKLALYTSIFCVDFMSGYGQKFNGNITGLKPQDRRQLETILDRLIKATTSKEAEEAFSKSLNS